MFRFLTESWKPILNSSSFSLRGCWGQPMLLFWKLVDETQISKPQEYADIFKQNLTCIFISVRGTLKETFQYETPCIRKATTALVQYYSVLYDINRTIMWCSFSRGPIYLDHKRRSNRLVRYGSVMTQRFLEGSLSVLYIPHRRSKMLQLLSSLVLMYHKVVRINSCY